MQNKVDDVGFTRELLNDLAKVANVDADRIFATGLSNGGIMAHYVASELSDRIAAIAPVGGPLMMEAPRNKRPVPVMHFHGTADAFAPFQGGYGKGFLGRSKVTKFRSVDHTIQSWVKANGCNTEPEIVALPDVAKDKMKVNRRTWSGGEDGSEVVLIEIESLINRCIAGLYAQMNQRRYYISGAGGVFSAEDAYLKLRLGASLVQMNTAMIYNGPGTTMQICKGLVELMEREGFESLSQVIGSAHRETSISTESTQIESTTP